jgi:phage/plasmid-associated DNA primase
MTDSNEVELKRNMEYFDDFMKLHRAGKGHPFTHTCVGGISGSFYIENGVDHQKFLNLYCKIFQDADFSLSEKQCEVGPLMTDYDFVFDAEHTSRMYTDDDIERVVKVLNEIICETMDVSEDEVIAFVTEKKKPTIEYEKDESDEGSSHEQKIKRVKDGFHICYIIPMTIDQRQFIYHKLKETAERDDIFENIPFTNTYDDILDVSTISRNNWMMYGSYKQPNGQRYILTKVYKSDMSEEDIDNYTPEDLVTLFSVRQFDEDDQIGIRVEAQDEFLKFRQLETRKKENKKRVTGNVQPIVGTTRASSLVQKAKKLVAILNPEKRAYRYSDWTHLCWTLRSIDDSLYDDFIEISEKAPNFDKLACNKLWADKKQYSWTIGSLYHWAKEDNPEKYKEILRESNAELIQRAEDGSDTSIAKLIYAMYPNTFVCSSIKDSQWYEFKNHRWRVTDKAYAIHPIISEEISGMLMDAASNCLLMKRGAGSDEKNSCATKAANLAKMSRKLCDMSKMNTVVAACAGLFLDEKFEDKLDSNLKLIGFNNGIYDLSTLKFRNGTPDDLVSLTTGYDYVEFTGKEPVFSEIEDYFDKIQTNKNIREYLLRYIAGSLDGSQMQRVHFWTGSGCHSADTEILMYDGSVKRAKDIYVGDQLMGDDSTPRNVRTLFTGAQDMYSVTLSDGSSFIANANHRLALKSIHTNDIFFDASSKTYIVEYHKMTQDGPVKMTKYFPITANADNIAKRLAQEYLEKKNMRSDTIKYGKVIPITILNYIKLNDEIKKSYVCYRNVIEFASRPIMMDAYKVGHSLKCGNIPTTYMLNTMKIREKVLAGILDNFGDVCDDKVFVVIADEQLMHDVIFMCRSMGIHTDTIDTKTIKLSGNITRVKCNHLQINEYSNSEHDLTYSFTVENIGRGQFYGFAVDNNERYILQNCIVTYNSNGKSLTTSLIKKTFGKYYCTLEHTVLTQKRAGSSQATPELADKRGTRFAVMQEPEESDKINVSFMKQLSGDDELNVRALFKNCFSYTPQFKLNMVCNVLPSITAIDGGTWRRVVVVPFDSEFVEHPTKPHQFHLDINMKDKMKEWHQPFMWLLLNKYYPIWNNDKSVPSEVTIKTDTYKRQCDMYRDFVTGMYEITDDDDDLVRCDELYPAFKLWYKEAFDNMKASCPSKRVFIDNIEKSMNLKTIDNIVHKLKLKSGPERSQDVDVDKM